MRSIVEEALTKVNADTTEVRTENEDLDQILKELKTEISVFGCGGSGSNTNTRMKEEGIHGAKLIALNTDAHALVKSTAPLRLCVGEKLTRGLGVGGDHNLGKMAAEESRDEITKAIQGSDMLFITAGMGGGTGTGAAPIVAEIARELGILTIAIVTRPFSFEGAQRRLLAGQGSWQRK